MDDRQCTQFNMNVNEVVANRAKQILQSQGKDLNVHPNDHVNHSQSSNDTFPTGLHMVGVLLIEEKLFPAMEALYQALRAKQEALRISSKSAEPICRMPRR